MLFRSVATFGSVSVSAAGSGYTFVAGSGTLTAGVSAGFNIVSAGQALRVAFQQQPTTTTSGSVMTPSITVAAVNSTGQVVTSYTGTISLSLGAAPAGATLGGTVSVAAVNGVATFSTLALPKAGTGYALTASGTGLSGATSGTFAINVGPAAKWGYRTTPISSPVAGDTLPPFSVEAQDANGNFVGAGSQQATLCHIAAIGGGGVCPNPRLDGVLTVAAVNGIATFTGIRVRSTITGGMIASGGGLALAGATVAALPGAAAKLSFCNLYVASFCSANPGNLGGIVANTSYPWVWSVLDSLDNLNPNGAYTVSMVLGNNPGSATLSGTLAAVSSQGYVFFNSVSISAPAIGYSMIASAPGLTSGTVASFTVTVGAPSQLTYIVQPSNALVSQSITPPLQIAVQDVVGNTVTSAAGNVTLTIGTNPGGATLGGTLTASVVNGIASFPNTTLSAAGAGYTLRATTTVSGVAGTFTSVAFNVTDPNAPTSLSFQVQPPASVTAGGIMAPQLTVQVIGLQGTQATSATNAVTIAVDSGPAGALSLQGTLTRSAVGGVISFNDLVLRTSGQYRLRATASGLTTTFSSYVTVGPSAVSTVVFIDSLLPGTVAGIAYPSGTVLRAAVVDQYSNIVTSSSATFTIAFSGPNALNGTSWKGLPAVGPGWTGSVGSVYGCYQGFGTPQNQATMGTATGPSVAALNGIATFDLSGVRVRQVGGGGGFFVRLGATGPGVLVRPSISTAPAAALVFDPATQAGCRAVYTDNLPRVANATLTSGSYGDLRADVVDSIGNWVTTTNPVITLGIVSGTTGTLTGTTVRLASGGEAAFPGVTVTQPGNIVLSASAPGLTTGTTPALPIAAFAAAASLRFQVQPPNGNANVALSPAVQVAVIDAYGNIVTNSVTGISLGIVANPGGATLSGSGPVTPVNGIATFNALALSAPGVGYTLQASGTGLGTLLSLAFTIIP